MKHARALIFTQPFINGEFVAGEFSSGDHHFSVTNPADNSELARVTQTSPQQVEQAIDCSNTAFSALKNTTAYERASTLQKWYTLVLAHKKALAELITLEQGKPLAEALSEVNYGASYIKWYAEQATRSYGEIIPSSHASQQLSVIKQGIGVVAGITPWNFPLAMITRKVAPAYAAGCSFILKPAELTPLCALALAHLAHQAGFVKGSFNVLPTTQAQAVGKQLCDSPVVRKLTFTGSTAVGRTLLAQCANTIKRTSMELGGNAPFMVFNSADIDQAVTGLMASKFRNAGQTCIAANRVLLQREIADVFTTKLLAKVAALKVGDGLQRSVDLGALISPQAKQKAQHLVNDALANGAQQLTPNQKLTGNYQPPVVLNNISSVMAISQQEIFAPIVAIQTFTTEEEAIALANNVEYGLAAYFYSQDQGQIQRLSTALEYGMVGINEVAISNPAAPFGGVKQSGLGREGGHQGLHDYQEEKYLCQRIQ